MSSASVETPSRSALPPHLEEKLRTCEAIAERMRVLQQQVDSELQQFRRAPTGGPTTPYRQSPAILAAVQRVLL